MTEIEATRAKLKCLEMVDGTGLHWWNVIRHPDFKFDNPHLGSFNLYELEFALGVVEGKPVWEGDTLYDSTGCAFAAGTIEDGRIHGYVNANVKRVMPIELVSWNKPKPATLMVELPIEDVEFWNNLGEFFCFKNKDAYEIASSRFYKSCKKALEQLK